MGAGSAPIGAARLAAQTDSAPTPVVDAIEEYYIVDRPTLSGVVEELNDMRLEGPQRPRSQGLTRYRIVPTWRPVASGGACRVGALRLDVNVVVTLPSWTGAAAATESEGRRWEHIFGAIRDHEYAHRDLTIAAAKQLATSLRSLETRGCPALRRSVSGTMSLANERLDWAHAEFDRATPERLIGD